MKSLKSIQKTYQALQILVRAAMYFCLVGASMCLAGALCAAAGHTSGKVFGLLGQPLIFDAGEKDWNTALLELLSGALLLGEETIVLFFAERYLKTGRTEGTPFTENGARRLCRLGIRCIYLPIVASVMVAVLRACLNAEGAAVVQHMSGVGVGVLLILFSLILRYGAELEKRIAQSPDDQG